MINVLEWLWYNVIGNDWFWVGVLIAGGFWLFVGVGTLLKFLLWWDWGLYLTMRAFIIWGAVGAFIGWFFGMIGMYGGR